MVVSCLPDEWNDPEAGLETVFGVAEYQSLPTSANFRSARNPGVWFHSSRVVERSGIAFVRTDLDRTALALANV